MDYPDYDPLLDSPPLDDAELDALDALLNSLLSESAMNIEGLDGFLTALAAGPPLLARLRSADWMPAIWGGAEFASRKQAKRAAVLVLRHLHSIERRLREARETPAAWEPVLSVAETAQGDEFADAEDWCIGFLQAVALDPPAWAPLFDDAELGPALRPIVLLGAEDGAPDAAEQQALDDPAGRDALSRRALDAVGLLHARKPA